MVGSCDRRFGKPTWMRNIRLIARLDVKAPNLVKGVQFEGLRKLGNPNDFARRYYQEGIDEIYYEDIVASLYERSSILSIVESTTQDVFVPITVGGGLRSVEDVSSVLRVGADKVAINTAAIRAPEIISKVARAFGSQCVVLSVQAKKHATGWEAYFDNGRERSGLDALEWAKRGEALGAGEIILTSVDREGTKKGFDVELVNEATSFLDIPVVASGGMGTLEHLGQLVSHCQVDAVAMANVLHYKSFSVESIRNYCLNQEFPVRRVGATLESR